MDNDSQYGQSGQPARYIKKEAAKVEHPTSGSPAAGAPSTLDVSEFDFSQRGVSFKRPQNCHELVTYYHQAPKVEQRFLIQQLLHQMNSGAGFRPTEAHWRDQIAVLGILDPDVSSTWLQCVFDGWQGELLQSDWMRDVLIATLLRLQYYHPEALTAEGVTRIMDALLDQLADAETLLGRIPDNAERTWEGILMTISLLSQTLGAGIGEPLFRKLQKQVNLLEFNVGQLKEAYEALEKAEKKQEKIAKKQGLSSSKASANLSQTVAAVAEDPIVKARARYRRMRQLTQILEANYDCLAILRTRSQKVEQVGATVKRFVSAVELAVTGAVVLTAGTVVLGATLAALPATYGAAAVVVIPALAAFFGSAVAAGYSFIQAARESGEGLLNMYYLGRNADEHPINGLLAGSSPDALTLPDSITERYLTRDPDTGEIILNKKVRGTGSSHLLQFLQGLLINTGAAAALLSQHRDKVARWMGTLLRALYAAHTRGPSKVKAMVTGDDTLYDSVCAQTLLLSQLLIRRFNWPLLTMIFNNPAEATLANWTLAYQQDGWLAHGRDKTGQISEKATKQLVHYITLCQPAFETPPLHIPVVLSWWDHWYKDKHVESAWALYQGYQAGDTALGRLLVQAYEKMVMMVVTAQSRMTNDNYTPLLSWGALESALSLKTLCANEIERLRSTFTLGQIDRDALAQAMLHRKPLLNTNDSNTSRTIEAREAAFIANLFPWLLVSSYRSDLILQTPMGDKALSLDDYDTQLTAWCPIESPRVSQQKIEALNPNTSLPQYLRLSLAKEDIDERILTQLSGHQATQGQWGTLSLDKLFVPVTETGIKLHKGREQATAPGVERQIVYGKPGVGNSTLCRFLATKWAEQKYWQLTQTPGATIDSDGIGGYYWVFTLDVQALCALPAITGHNGRTAHALATAVYNLCLSSADRQKAEEELHNHRKASSASPQALNPQALRAGVVDWIEAHIIAPEAMQPRTLWVIDGLDRAQTYLYQPTALGRLLKRLLDHPNLFIVTTPLAHLPVMPPLQRILVNRGFLEKDIVRYVYRYFNDTPAMADELWAVLERNKDRHMWNVCRTPLLLTLVCRLWDQAEDTANRAQLAAQWESGVTAFYSAIVQAFFEAQYHREQMSASNNAALSAESSHTPVIGLNNLEPPEARRQRLFAHYGPLLSALGQLAFEGIRHQCETLNPSLLQEVATAQGVKDIAAWLSQLRASGLFQAHRSQVSLRSSNSSLCAYGFTHSTIQPYLAAGYIVHILNNPAQPLIRKQMEDFIIAHRYEPHWQGVWPLVVGITCETSLYMRAREAFWNCLHAAPEDITGFGYLRLITECLEATYIGGKQADATLRGWRKSWEQLVKDWVPSAVADGGSSHWEALASILTPLNHMRRALLTSLLVSMEEAGGDVERQCHYLNQLMTGIVLLQERLLPSHKERLFAYLKSDAAPVRCAVAKGIALLVSQWKSDCKSLSTPVLAALRHETVGAVREQLGQILIAMGDVITEEATPQIQQQLVDAMACKDGNVRKTVMTVLVQWMDPDKSAACLTLLWGRYSETNDVWIKCDLLKILSLLGSTPSQREVVASRMMEIAVGAESHYLRRAALVALSEMVSALENGSERWMSHLLKIVRDDTHPSLRKKGADLMKAWVNRYAEVSYDETVVALQQALKREQDGGARLALEALVKDLKSLAMTRADKPQGTAGVLQTEEGQEPCLPGETKLMSMHGYAWDMIRKTGKDESRTRQKGLKLLFQYSKGQYGCLEADIDALIEHVLKEEDQWFRCDILKTTCTLALTSPKTRLKLLPLFQYSLLADTSPYVRRAAMRYLLEVAQYERAHENQPTVIGDISQLVLSAFNCESLKSEGLRVRLVQTLKALAAGGLVKKSEAVAILLSALKHEPSLVLRQHMVIALGTLGSTVKRANGVLEYLLQTMKSESNALLRDTILQSLQEIVQRRGGLAVVTTELEPALVINKTVTRADMDLLSLVLQSPLLVNGTLCMQAYSARSGTKTERDRQLSLWIEALVKAQYPLLVNDKGFVVYSGEGGVLLVQEKDLNTLKKNFIAASSTQYPAIQGIQQWRRSMLSMGYDNGPLKGRSSLKRSSLSLGLFKHARRKPKDDLLAVAVQSSNVNVSFECPML